MEEEEEVVVKRKKTVSPKSHWKKRAVGKGWLGPSSSHMTL